MTEAIAFWLAKPIAELVWAVGIGLFFVLVWAALCAPTAYRQWRCKHPTFRETRRSDAICNRCNKNLGFIQPWRDKQRAAMSTTDKEKQG